MEKNEFLTRMLRATEFRMHNGFGCGCNAPKELLVKCDHGTGFPSAYNVSASMKGDHADHAEFDVIVEITALNETDTLYAHLECVEPV